MGFCKTLNKMFIICGNKLSCLQFKKSARYLATQMNSPIKGQCSRIFILLFKKRNFDKIIPLFNDSIHLITYSNSFKYIFLVLTIFHVGFLNMIKKQPDFMCETIISWPLVDFTEEKRQSIWVNNIFVYGINSYYSSLKKGVCLIFGPVSDTASLLYSYI